jgi:hypothetical protein
MREYRVSLRYRLSTMIFALIGVAAFAISINNLLTSDSFPKCFNLAWMLWGVGALYTALEYFGSRLILSNEGIRYYTPGRCISGGWKGVTIVGHIGSEFIELAQYQVEPDNFLNRCRGLAYENLIPISLRGFGGFWTGDVVEDISAFVQASIQANKSAGS